MTAEPDAEEVSRPGRIGQRALSAALSRRNELRHAVRVSVAVGAAFAASRLLDLPQGYWAVFTAVIVVQTSIGGTITASLERLLGTVVGGAVGVAAAYLRASTVLEEGLVLAGAVALLAFAAAIRPSLRVAPITAAIVLVGGSSHLDPLQAALWRIAEIVIGGVIGVAATLLVFPARASRAVAERAARSMVLTADLLDQFAVRMKGEEIEPGLHQAHRALRKALGLVEQAVGESKREGASGFRRSEAPEGLLRSLWRVRNDAVMVGRALAQPLPAAVAGQLSPAAIALLQAIGADLRACAEAVRAGRAPPTEDLAQPRAAFEDAVERIRRARLTSDMTFDPAARVFGLVFALEDLLANLGDLADRVGEMAEEPAVRPA